MSAFSIGSSGEEGHGYCKIRLSRNAHIVSSKSACVPYIFLNKGAFSYIFPSKGACIPLGAVGGDAPEVGEMRCNRGVEDLSQQCISANVHLCRSSSQPRGLFTSGTLCIDSFFGVIGVFV